MAPKPKVEPFIADIADRIAKDPGSATRRDAERLAKAILLCVRTYKVFKLK